MVGHKLGEFAATRLFRRAQRQGFGGGEGSRSRRARKHAAARRWGKGLTDGSRAIQRSARQSARKMRLVIDLIRGRAVPEALRDLEVLEEAGGEEIHKVLQSAVANAGRRRCARTKHSTPPLRVKYAVIQRGPAPQAVHHGRHGPRHADQERTSHVEIHVASEAVPVTQAAHRPRRVDR